jgi:hypothetical protein
VALHRFRKATHEFAVDLHTQNGNHAEEQSQYTEAIKFYKLALKKGKHWVKPIRGW